MGKDGWVIILGCVGMAGVFAGFIITFLERC